MKDVTPVTPPSPARLGFGLLFGLGGTAFAFGVPCRARGE
jgi:hypothetical protein